MSQFRDPFDTSRPPTEPGEVPGPPRGWPKVIGIISIVWGSLGLLCNGCGLISQVFQSAFMGMISRGGAGGGPGGGAMAPIPDVMKPNALDFLPMVAGVGVTILLIVAGSMLVSRRPVSRPLHIAYGVLSLLVTVVGTALAVLKQQAIMAWAAENPDDFWAMQQSQAGVFAYAAVVIGALIGGAYPLFVLIWFLAVKRDTTEITASVDQEPSV